MKKKAARIISKNDIDSHFSNSELNSNKYQFISIETIENSLFCLIVFSLVAAFNFNIQEQFTLPKLLVFRIGSLVLCALLMVRLYLGQMSTVMPRTILYIGSALPLWWIISTFFSVHLSTSIHGFHGRYNGLINNLLYIFIFFSFALSSLRFKRIELFLKIFILALLPVALYAILQHFNLDPYQWPSKRPASTMGNPVLLSATVGLALPFVLYFMVTTKVLFEKIIAVICLTVFVFAIYITLSRAPWFGIILSSTLVLTMALRYKLLNWNRSGLYVFAFMVACITLYTFNSSFGHRFIDRFKGLLEPKKDVSITKRVAYYDAALAMIKDRPFTGSGFENYRVLYPRYRSQSDSTPKLIPTMVHNVYIERAVSNGIPGLLIYLAFISAIIHSIIKAAKAAHIQGKTKLFHYSFLAALVGYLVQEMSGWQDVSLAAFFWMIAGMSVATCKQTFIETNDFGECKMPGYFRISHSFSRKLHALCLVTILLVTLYLCKDAALRLKVDSIFWQAKQMNPVKEWSDLESIVQTGLNNSRGDYHYEDMAGMIYTKRFAATDKPEAYSQALQLFEQAFQHNPHDSYILLHLLELDGMAIRKGKIQRPSQLAEHGIGIMSDIDKNNAYSAEMIGKFYTQSKKYPEALTWLQKLRQAGVAAISADLLEGEIARGMGDTNRALLVVREAIRKMEMNERYTPRWANAKLIVASIEMELKHTESALQETLDVSKNKPQDARSYILRGDIYAIRNDISRARDSYRDALLIEPTNPYAKKGYYAAEQLLQRTH